MGNAHKSFLATFLIDELISFQIEQTKNVLDFLLGKDGYRSRLFFFSDLQLFNEKLLYVLRLFVQHGSLKLLEEISDFVSSEILLALLLCVLRGHLII